MLELDVTRQYRRARDATKRVLSAFTLILHRMYRPWTYPTPSLVVLQTWAEIPLQITLNMHPEQQEAFS